MLAVYLGGYAWNTFFFWYLSLFITYHIATFPYLNLFWTCLYLFADHQNQHTQSGRDKRPREEPDAPQNPTSQPDVRSTSPAPSFLPSSGGALGGESEGEIEGIEYDREIIRDDEEDEDEGEDLFGPEMRR